MKKGTLYLSGILVMLVLGACGSKSEETATEEETSESAESKEACMYFYNEGTTNFTFTAYKTTDKVGVNGGFNEILVSSEQSEDPREVIESMSFSIKTASLETNDASRNLTITESFFNVINTPYIEGAIKELKSNGKAVVEIMMNSTTNYIEGDYTLDGAMFTFTSDINMADWNATAGIDSLNVRCKDLHAGADGVSKTWPDVHLALEMELLSDCK